MIIRKKTPRALGLNEPLRHPDHKRPVTRRDFLAQGFMTGAATVVVPSMVAALLNPRTAKAASQVIQDLDPTGTLCNISLGAGKIPFICFDLAGGANIAGSNVLVGQAGGQLDVLSTAGYSKLGLPGNMLPNSSTRAFVDTTYGLAFHSDSAFLRGMQMTATTAGPKTQGAVIPARSENDTGNNPHNPMYGIARTGSKGQLLTLIGSQNSDSGGNSMAPADLIDLSVRPTKIDRPSDATGLVDTGQLGSLLGNVNDTVAVMESIDRITRAKLAVVDTAVSNGAVLEQQVDCAYVRSAYMAEQFSSPSVLDPTKDPIITQIFSAVGGISADQEYGKTAAVMKLVIDGMAGAGTISMGGFDYHTGDRATGEARDLRAGQCMGACLEYAARTGKPLMLYVFSDGSLSSNGMIDNSVGGRGKGQWTGDNQSTAASFFLVYSPTARPSPIVVPALGGGVQLGRFRASGDIETTGSPGANSVTALVDMVLLNYLALHSKAERDNFPNIFQNSPFAAMNAAQLDAWTAFAPIV